MKKLILAVFIVVCFCTTATAKTYHFFFIDQKEVVAGWTVFKMGTDPDFRYFVDPADPMPDIGNPIAVVIQAQVGANFMFYARTRSASIAAEAMNYAEFAGGGISEGDDEIGVLRAWIDFIMRSRYQLDAHATFAADAAFKNSLRARYKVAGEWVDGKITDWDDAGKPEPVRFSPGTTIFGD